MELSTIKTPSLVVALDIGSTYSGYAWQRRSDGGVNLSTVEYNTSWGLGALQLLKTSTSLLLNANNEVDSFGYRAEKRYCQFIEDKNGPTYYLFRHFKLRLYNQNSTENIHIEAVSGETYNLMTVMSKFIGALKDHFLDMMRDKNINVDLKRTLWVITVPAIWTEASRSFMRAAAIEAGISKYNILLALEPEVAAIYCLHQVVEDRTFGTQGRKFITVDLGGGTVDITAFEVLDDGFMKEICAGTGACVGSQDINSAFFVNWKEAFRETDWKSISAKHTQEEILDMETDFERNKVEIGSSEEDECIRLAIPDTTREMLINQEIQLKDSEEVKSFFQMKNRKFTFNSRAVREKLFRVTTERIIETIDKLMKDNNLGDVNTMVFVGGFSECKLVIDEIKRVIHKLYPYLNFVTPTSPFRAVLTGAVMFGHNPRIFRSRISRKTYGVRTSSYFDHMKHDRDKVYLDPVDGEEYIRGIFDVHVRKGSSVSLNDEQSPVIYYPKRENARRVRIQIYSSDEDSPEFITDEGCRKECEIIVDLPETSHAEDRQIVVQMIYGGTQLHVIAKEGSTDYNATIKFD